MNDLEIADACSAGFNFHAIATQSLSGGRINRNLRVETSDGPLLLRIYPPGRSSRQIAFEMNLLTHLHSKGCRVPRPVQSAGAPRVLSTPSGHAVWTEYLDGLPLEDDQAFRLEPQELHALLEPVFRHLEDFNAPFSKTTETHVFQRRLPSLLAQLKADGQIATTLKVQELFRHLQALERKLVLPVGAVHADIHPQNVLCNSTGSLWLIDFDDGHVGNRVADRLLPCLEFSFDEHQHLHQERYDKLVEALVLPLATPEEVASLEIYRAILTLKFSVALADLGDPLSRNRYWNLLKKDTLSA